MNNVKKNRTGLRLLGSVNNGNYKRFTMNKTQQNQPVYSKVQPRCPGSKGKRGNNECQGSNTKVGCKTCWGCTYSFDVSNIAFSGTYPTYGSFINLNPIVDSSGLSPCEWQYNGSVDSFQSDGDLAGNGQVSINIENDTCINTNDIFGIYFYAPVGGATGLYIGEYRLCNGALEPSSYPSLAIDEGRIVTTATRMGAPYRNPIAGWRNSLDCCENGYDTTSGASQQTIHTLYKDNYSGKKNEKGGCCAKDCSNTTVHRPGIQGRTHRPIIRSGMQEITGCCKQTVKTLAPVPGGMQYVDIVRCKPKSDYSFSYRQYMNNKRCLSFDRSLEKSPGTYSAITKNKDGQTICQMKYRKSGCAGCCQCCVKRQMFFITQDSNIPNRGDRFVARIDNNSNTTIGTIDAVWTYPNGLGLVLLVDNGLNDICDGIREILQSGQTITNLTSPSISYNPVVQSTTPNGYYPYVYDVESRKGECGSNKSNTVTIYKPNNKKFSKQGAVSAGSRLERLKLDTVRSANSRCKKGKKCATVPARPNDPFNKCKLPPNGKYDAGKPRFTGWMFNGHHSEIKGRVYNMVRYNQQPLGIPQLTANPPGKTCIKKCFPRTLNLGSNRPTAAGNRARIPGSKCVNSGNCNCTGCNNDPNYTNQGVPCC